MPKLYLFCLLGFLSVCPLSGSVIIGFVTFDHDAPITGQNEVSINNFTGSGFCDGTFTACDPLIFQNISLTLSIQGGPNQVYTSGPLGPGSSVPVSFVFPSSLNILSLVFSGTISPQSFQLFGGGTFIAGPAISSLPLVPNSNELSLLSVNAAGSATPEPSTALLLGGGILLGYLTRRIWLTGSRA